MKKIYSFLMMAVMAVVMSFTAKAASVTINVDDPNRVSVQLNSVEQTLEAGDNTFELTVGAPTYIYISAKSGAQLKSVTNAAGTPCNTWDGTYTLTEYPSDAEYASKYIVTSVSLADQRTASCTINVDNVNNFAGIERSGTYESINLVNGENTVKFIPDVESPFMLYSDVMGAKSILEGNPAPSPTSTTVTTTTKGGKSTSNLPSMGDFDKALAKSLTGSVDLKDVKDALSPYQMMLPEIKKNILDIKDADLGGALAMKGERQVKQEIEDINKSLIQQQKAYQLAGQAAMSFGAALQGIQDPATKAAGTVVQAVASIALGFATASAQANTAGTGWGWLAWLAAGASAMATTIATIHSLTGYAQGGMVKGNSYSGDNIFAGNAMVNAGELVLNKAQQATLAQNLQGEGRSINVQGILSGENILIATERTLKRKGRGELVTWK